jgi:multidrug efflux pump subunit AcrA (membrane-fusion protein)
MADENKRTIPPLRTRQPSRPSLDDSETARQLEQRERENARLLAELEAAKRQAHEATQQAQRRASESVAPKSGDIKVQATGSAKSWALLVLALSGVGLGGASLVTKADDPRVTSQGDTIAVTRDELNVALSRLEALEKSDRRQNALHRATMDYTIQVLEDGKIAILKRPQGLPPMRPIETHWPRPLPGRNAVAPILIVDTPYPTIEWVTE